MRLILALLLCWCVSLPLMAASVPESTQLKQELENAKADKTATQQDRVQTLEAAIKSLDEREKSLARTQFYQKVIDDFPKMSRELRQQIAALTDSPKSIRPNITSAELDQEILQVSSQQVEESRQAQQEQERSREISDSLSQLPQQQTDARRALSEIERRLQAMPKPANSETQAQQWARQAESAALKTRVDELQLAQLSANNRQELARMRAELHQKQAEQLDSYLQALRNHLNSLRQREAELALERTELLAENSADLPPKITEQFRVNRELSAALNQQAQRMDLIASQQRQATNNTIKVRQALSTIREQSQWLGVSNVLGEALRAQVARLPDMPQSQQLDSDMAQLRVQRLYYEDRLSQQNQLRQLKQENGDALKPEQKRILDAQLRTQSELLGSLISGSDNLILEVTKLKVANGQLSDALDEIKQAAHRYLFWSADVNPMGLTYPLEVARDLHRMLSLDTLGQLGSALVMMFTSKETIFPIIGAVLLVGFSISSRRHYHAFLARAASRVGKVTQDQFSLTMRTVFWSIVVAIPIPVLWWALGYGLQQAWPYPIAVAIGKGITATLPVLWAFMISASFARPQGLFITHFRWPQARVSRAMRYYRLSIGLIVPLIMLLIACGNIDDRTFSSTLGRLCFILICGALCVVTLSLKRAGIPLHLDKEGNGENMLNTFWWNLLLCIPLVAAFASGVGYLATAQALLGRLEMSVAIWFLLLVVYHIVRRWMLIQRRRIAFDRARQRRAEILAQRARGEEEALPASNGGDGGDIDEPVIDLDAISAQSLRLVRSLLTMIALVSVIVLWSEIHSAFGFLENIRLWDVSTTVQGVESLQPITLGAILIAVLVFIITTQLVRNLPAMLELGLLQHLSLTPGTGYAITTLTKYMLLLIGGLTGFSLLGIEWSKLQWLVAGLTVGLGFGLQEIFANFISGLIILFEKPIRIGDTVTIRDLTGSITRINTRATTITDWDRKEIIVPNKAFITEQFVNWSLSDSVTRVVLTIPAPAHANSEEVAQMLVSAAHRCHLVLDNPIPEAFLVDLQQGIQLYELRLFAAEMGHRMPLRHEMHRLILEAYKEHGLEMPFPPFQVRMEMAGRKTPTSPGAPAARQYKSGGL
ncbi:miniconductance mechanosensitive channel MscM [Enterobacterales bacterium CwR94]|nr:miniconductance mechanosensitive channel MscM [Enterobacterales bacterium CwR94]